MPTQSRGHGIQWFSFRLLPRAGWHAHVFVGMLVNHAHAKPWAWHPMVLIPVTAARCCGFLLGRAARGATPPPREAASSATVHRLVRTGSASAPNRLRRWRFLRDPF